MKFVGRPRHPLTGRRLFLSARSRTELASYMQRIESLRTEMKLGLCTPEDVDRALRHLRHGPVTFERAAVAYLQRPSLAKITKSRVRGLLRLHMASLLSCTVASLDGPTLSGWIRELESAGLHSTTIAMIWRTLRAIVGHAAERGWIGALPWGAWRPMLSRAPKRAQREAARSVEELARLLIAARGVAFDLEAKIACAGLLGLRQGELAGLRWTDIDPGPPPAPPRVLIARQWDGRKLKKGAQPKWIETIPELLAILGVYRNVLAVLGGFDPKGPIFPCAKASGPSVVRPYASGEVLTRLNLRAAVKRAGLPSVGSWSAHSLRDTFVTLEAMGAHGDLPRVAARTRHASIANLARYLRALSRDPAPPGVTFLPGTTPTGAGVPLLDSHDHNRDPKETPP